MVEKEIFKLRFVCKYFNIRCSMYFKSIFDSKMIIVENLQIQIQNLDKNEEIRQVLKKIDNILTVKYSYEDI